MLSSLSGSSDPPIRNSLTIYQLTTKVTRTCRSGHTLAEAVQMMREEDCGCLLLRFRDRFTWIPGFSSASRPAKLSRGNWNRCRDFTGVP
jgi:hypothetical protein